MKARLFTLIAILVLGLAADAAAQAKPSTAKPRRRNARRSSSSAAF